MNSGLKRGVWILNTLGLIIYMVWLYSMGDREILRAQDGILYFLPCIPFFFVYLLMIPPKPHSTNEEGDKPASRSSTETAPPPSSC